MHEIAQFLSRHPPFDSLEPERLAEVAAAAEIEFHAAGAPLLSQGGEAATRVGVVRRGAVELRSDGRLLDLLTEGEMFGHPSLLAESPSELSVTANEDTLIYSIPAAVIVPVLARPAGLRFVARSLAERTELRTRDAVLAAGDPGSRPVSELLHREPLVCTADTTVQEAAARMTAAHTSSIVVDLGREGLGIVTNQDMRTRVVAAGLPPQTPVAAVMTAPAETVSGELSSSDVLLAMLERNVHHFPVMGVRGALLGVVAAPDLLAVEARAPFHLRSAISGAANRDALATAVRRLPDAVVALADARTDAQVISRIIAAVHDAATERLIELVEAELGPAPAAYAWLMLGSVARREAFPSSDHDSALVYADSDDPAVPEWMERLTTSVVDGLDACGIPRCSNGATAAMALFRRPLSQWQRMTTEWLEHPDAEKALILVSVVVDGRRLCGSEALTDRIAATLADARNHEMLLHRLGLFALSHRPPTGFFRDFVLTHEGERFGALDIKRGGLLPVVDLARWAAITTGVTAASTTVRLDAAEAAGVIDRADATTLRDAFDLFTQLRMDHQVAQLHGGGAPDDRLDPRTLSPLTRGHLKHAFRAVARVQRGIGYTGLTPA